MARYKQLLFFATKLAPLPAEDHIPANKVEGCVSQVWVVPELRDDGLVYWRADSDSQLTKGLAALLVTGLSGCTPAEILTVEPGFIEMLGLKQSLTPSRNNGFLNMFRLMQRKTLELVAAQAATAGQAPAAAEPAASAAEAPAAAHSSNGNGNGASAAPAAAPAPASAPAPAPESRTPVTDAMRRKLTEALRPAALAIVNESEQHAGHAGAAAARHGKAGQTGETHFRVEVVSEAFEGMTLVKRQRMIYALLEEEFAMGLHALSLVTKTPAEAAKVAA
ncbi:hypothetical protein GPECTOR_179g247 [Gonium pectorale]|uniref:Fe-S metabolism associated domain-containing protein n=1 Tax=Gonium pectorale TaxID=33097 RepID=A0A150FX71_GONPE|nr:hypothetical protein GPECTOR_179g247 [Gonium pectorale]|eukprot:KXZ42224.1 hypothetical protein GPECTOR_179g247 [Gonium pectorale]